MNVHSLPGRPHLPPSDVELESRQWLPAAAARIPAAWTVRATLIHARQERFGFALVTATHDVDVAARADRMITLADGEVLDHEEMAA